MAVIQLVQYSCRETISALRVLLELATRGRLRGLIVCYRMDDGAEKTIFTGAYKAHPGRAAEAGLRISVQMMQTSGEID